MSRFLLERIRLWPVDLNREGAGFLLVCLFCVGVGYAALLAHQRADRQRSRASTFRNLLAEYRRVLPRIPDRGRRPVLSNPLAYLENTLQERDIARGRVGALTPVGTDQQGGTRFRLRLRSVSPAAGLSLLKTLESEDRLTVSRFSMERTGVESRRFDVHLRLRVPGRSNRTKGESPRAF